MMPVKLTQNTTVIELELIRAVPLSEPATVITHEVPGTLGGKLQFLGTKAKKLRIDAFVRGSGAKTIIDNLKSFQSSGKLTTVEVTIHGQTWVSADFFITSIEFDVEPGKPSSANALKVKVTMELLGA